MGMAVNTNLSAINAQRNLSNTQNDLSKSLEKLSSGLRINRAADDAAGLSISEGLRSQSNGYGVAARNAQDGISVIQTAEGGLTEVHSILQRMRDLAVQAGNDSNNADSRKAISTEVGQLSKELDRIAETTNFNGIKLLDAKKSLTFQVGADGDANSQIAVDLTSIKSLASDLTGGDLTTSGSRFAVGDVSALADKMSFTTTKDGVTTTVETKDLGDAGDFASVEDFATALRGDEAFAANFSVAVEKDANGAGVAIVVTALNGGSLEVADNASAGTGVAAGETPGATVTGGLKFDSAEMAQASIRLLDEKITAVSSARSDLGAVQNRFESAINSLNVGRENLTAAESRIRDVDMAAEMVKFTKANILSQAGTSMLAQANQSSQGVLSLLR